MYSDNIDYVNLCEGEVLYPVKVFSIPMCFVFEHGIGKNILNFGNDEIKVCAIGNLNWNIEVLSIKYQFFDI